MKRISKGCRGYRNYRRKIQILEIALGAAMILGQLAARNFTDNEAAKNILTVLAVLMVLPVANVASPFLAAIRCQIPKDSFYQAVSPYEGRCRILYELIITSKEQIIPIDAAAVHPSGVYLCCTGAKLDKIKAETFLKEMFSAHGLGNHIKIFTDEESFKRRLKSLKPQEAAEADILREASLLKQLSM